MALIEISQEVHSECDDLDTICLVHGDEIARLNRAHATEVVSLRRKIDALESALAVAEVSRAAKVPSLQATPPLTSISFDAPATKTASNGPATNSSSTYTSDAATSAFASSQQPAVVSVESAARRIDGTDASAVQSNPPSTEDAARQSGAAAPARRKGDRAPVSEEPVWGVEASFEERMAAKEFFAESNAATEPAWRRWLLKKA